MGRKKTVRQRIGHLEQKRLRAIVARIRSFKIAKADEAESEATLNKRLNAWIQEIEPTWTSSQHLKVPFGVTDFNPDGTLSGNKGRLPLVAYEGKKMGDVNPQKAWKEGIGQAFTYRVLFKTAILVLYDFSNDAAHVRALGRGNSVESTFASKIRKKWRIIIVAIMPQ